MSDYWDTTDDGKPKEPRPEFLNLDRCFHVVFANGTTFAISLPKDDTIWQVWEDNHVMHLFVMSSYPRIGEDYLGEEDTRRAIIPLGSNKWDKNVDHVDVQIDRSRVTLITHVTDH